MSWESADGTPLYPVVAYITNKKSSIAEIVSGAEGIILVKTRPNGNRKKFSTKKIRHKAGFEGGSYCNERLCNG